MTFAAFAVCLGFSTFLDWDDKANFLDNPHYRGLGAAHLRWMFSSYHMGHYIPLTWITLGLDWILASRIYGNGLDARVYHATNNLIHAVNAGLFYLLTVWLLDIARGRSQRAASSGAVAGSTGEVSYARVPAEALEAERRPWSSVAAAAIAALLFAVHPLRVESVAWVTERRDLLSAFFVLLMLLVYVRAPGWGAGRGRWLAVVTALFALGALSKIIAIMLAPALLVLDWYPLRRIGWVDGRPLDLKSTIVAIVEKAPILIVGAALGGYATHLSQGQQWLAPLEVHGVWARVAQSFYGLVFYIWKTVAPTGLLPMYEMHLPLDPLEGRFIASAAAVCAAAIAMWLLRRRAAGVIAAALCYAIVLLPVLGPMQNGMQIVADRYSYLACMGWMVVLAAGLERLWTRRAGTPAPLVAVLLLVAAIAACAFLTRRQCLVWKDTATLWEYMVRNDPGSSYAQNSFGWVRYEQGAVDEAIGRYREAIRIYPVNLQAHRNLFIALLRTKKDYPALLEACDVAAETKTGDRQFMSDVFFNRGEALRLLKQFDEAMKSYRRSMELTPNLPRAWEGLARAQEESGRREDAIKTLRQAIQVMGGSQRCRELLAKWSPGG